MLISWKKLNFHFVNKLDRVKILFDLHTRDFFSWNATSLIDVKSAYLFD